VSVRREAGVFLPVRGIGADSALELGRLAADLRYDSVWIAEIASYDAYALTAVLASMEPSIRVGTGIVPVGTRSPVVHALSAATLGALAPGRTIVGVGVSTPTIVEGWHGMPHLKPLEATRRWLDALDDALGDRKAATGFRLERAPDKPPRRVLGAMGPAMRRLARERCDGLLVGFTPRSRIADLVRTETPRDRDYEVAVALRLIVGPGQADAEWRFRREIASYLRIDHYAAWIRNFGFESEVEFVRSQRTLNEMARALPDHLVEDLVLTGSAERCRAEISKAQRDGATVLLIPDAAPGDVAATADQFTALAPAGQATRAPGER
jgi:alkanesulfonate monooxygenase SsuD/methylene tetrahydromethanopterin reductase-like flavin-dependent oxidoreductase (luciferase family)